MDVDRREQVVALFAEALELPSSLHEEWLRSACSGDERIMQQVAEMLREDSRAAAYFDDLAHSLFGQDLPQSALSADPLGLLNERVSRYRIVEYVGGGGMGVVYRAVDERLRREVALKFLPPDRSRDREAQHRFRHEAQAVSSLDHPNICTVYEIDEHGSHLFIAMAFCEGQTLKQRMAAGRLELEEALRISVQIARGLAHAHSRGIVHRDVKPANVLLLPDERVKLVDFGLAKLSDRTEITTPGAAVGTAAYMSPEQIRGQTVDSRADVWALGVLLYEMFAGCRPFQGADPQVVLYAILNSDPEPLSQHNPDLAPELIRLVEGCLQREPRNRSVDAAAVAEALELMRQAPLEARVGAVGEGRPVPRRRSSIMVGGLALTLVAAVLGILVLKGPLSVELAAGGRPDHHRLAILPFEVPDADEELNEIAPGLAEVVGRLLSEATQHRGPAVQVIPARQVREFDLRSPRELRGALAPDLLATIGMNRAGDGVRVRVSLSDARTLRTIGTGAFTSHTSSTLPIYERIADVISSLLQDEGVPAGASSSSATGTADSVAFGHFVRGLAKLDRLDLEERVDGAIEDFRASIQRDPRFARAHAALCDGLWRKFAFARDNRWNNDATESCRRAIELDPAFAEPHVTLASVLAASGRYSEALASLDRALALDAGSAAALRERAKILTEMGYVREAEGVHHAALRLRPRDWVAHNALAMFYNRVGRQEEAVESLQRAISIVPENPWVYLNLGATYFSTGDLDKAREVWEAGLQIRDNYGILSNLASLSYSEERFADAAQAYERALELDDRDYLVWGNLASAYYWAPGMRMRSRAAFERAASMAEEQLAVNPDSPLVLARLAGYEAQLGKDAEARSHVHRAVDLAPDDGEVLFLAADAFEVLGEREQALAWLARAIEAGYSSIWIERYPGFEALRSDPRYVKPADSR